MSKIAAKGARYWLGANDLSGDLNAVDLEITQELPDASCFGDLGGRVVIGNYAHRHALRGLFDGSSSHIDAIANALIGTTGGRYLAQLIAGTAEASVVYESIAESAGQPIRVAAGAAIAQEIPMQGNSGLSRALVLANGTVASTLSLGNSIDQGATTGQYQAVFRFFSGTWTNCVLEVQESSNNSTWGVGSTALTASSTGNAKAVRVTSSGATLQYKRVAPTTFLGTDAVVAVTGGVVAGA